MGNCWIYLFTSASKPNPYYINGNDLEIKITLTSWLTFQSTFEKCQNAIQDAFVQNSKFIQYSNEKPQELKINNQKFEYHVINQRIGFFQSQSELQWNFQSLIATYLEYVFNSNHPGFFMSKESGKGFQSSFKIHNAQEEKRDCESMQEQHFVFFHKDVSYVKKFLKLTKNHQIMELNDLAAVNFQKNDFYILVIKQDYRGNQLYDDTIQIIEKGSQGFQKNVKVISIISDKIVDIDEKGSYVNGIYFQDILINKELDYKKLQKEIDKKL